MGCTATLSVEHGKATGGNEHQQETQLPLSGYWALALVSPPTSRSVQGGEGVEGICH
jgi:hypothetical protein